MTDIKLPLIGLLLVLAGASIDPTPFLLGWSCGHVIAGMGLAFVLLWVLSIAVLRICKK